MLTREFTDMSWQEITHEIEKIRMDCSDTMALVFPNLVKEGKSLVKEINHIAFTTSGASDNMKHNAVVTILCYYYFTNEGYKEYLEYIKFMFK